MRTITVHTLPACVQCNSTKRKLDSMKVDYQTVDVSLPENADALATMKGLGYQAAPVVLVTEDGKDDDHWYGFRPDKLEALAA